MAKEAFLAALKSHDDGDALEKAAAFLRQRPPEAASFLNSFLELIGRTGLSDNYLSGMQQIEFLNHAVSLGLKEPPDTGQGFGQVAMVMRFLENNILLASKTIDNIDLSSAPPIALEYAQRVFASLPDREHAIRRTLELRKKTRLTEAGTGTWLIPATLLASCMKTDLANELLAEPFEELLKPDMEIFYESPKEAIRLSDRYSYKTDGEQKNIFYKYLYELGRFKSPNQNESLMINSFFGEELTKFLKNDSGIKYIFNFGSTVGWLEYNLAKNFPNIQIIGYDESVVSKNLNEKHLPKLPNLSFVDGDLWSNLKYGNPHETLLIHCRTGTLFTFDALSELYRKFSEIGIRAIALAEHVRFDIVSGRFPDVSATEFTSKVKTKSGLTHIHNYRKALANFEGAPPYEAVVESRRPNLSYRKQNFMALGEYAFFLAAVRQAV